MRDTKRVAGLGLLVLAAVMVVAALFMVGGPMAARAQNRDAARVEDLRNIWWQLRCQARNGGEILPDAPAALAGCGDPPRLIDPETGQAYRYERLGPHAARLCAPIEGDSKRLADAVRPGIVVPEEAGCFDFAFTPENSPAAPDEPAPVQ